MRQIQMNEYIVYLERTNALSGNSELVYDFVKAYCIEAAKSHVYWVYGDLIDILFIEEWDWENDEKYSEMADHIQYCRQLEISKGNI